MRVGLNLCCLIWVLTASAIDAAPSPKSGAYHVHSGESIQQALNAAGDGQIKKVIVHEGVYRPAEPGHALIWLNARHKGIQLEAEGSVTLTAANPAISDPKSTSHPAIVNHVIYFGDGITTNTVVRGFKITGANNFVTRQRPRQIEPNVSKLHMTSYFFTDGGGIKIFGRSYPTLDSLEIFGNYTSPCGGGVSIEHPHEESRGQADPANAVQIRNCVFRNNRTQITGAALDLIWGSSAHLSNCLFVANVSNTGHDYISVRANDIPFTNNGVVTVFAGSRIVVENCTFAGNRNGVDDRSSGSSYRNCIFWQNNLQEGAPVPRYELNLSDGSGVVGCRIGGGVLDLNNTVSRERNVFAGPAPNFGSDFAPQSPEFSRVGYRPARTR